MTPKYVIGIDLGTTNSVLAYTELETASPLVRVLPVPQWTAIGQRENKNHLPSFCYFPTEREREVFELAPAGTEDATGFVAGTLAMKQSADHPDRTIASAKSWLCHSEVDRQAPILPWESAEGISRISPVQASAAYLRQLIEAWSEHFPEDPIQDQWVAVTVPASFDMAARELTKQAAIAAGLPSHFILLEEPQAAAYHWIQTIGDDWRKHVAPGDRMLVCDIGGGTTDLTLLLVEAENGELNLRRQAVGQHLLVGGDNMDLALAHYAATRFEQQGISLNAWQSVSLWHACRSAKEILLQAGGPERYTLSILGRGSKLIGGTVSIELTNTEVRQLLVDGFFPRCDSQSRPDRDGGSGFQELGLPYEMDTAITKHIAEFLSNELARNANESSNGSTNDKATLSGGPLRVLFNGGAFKAEPFRERLLEVLGSWTDLQIEPSLLHGRLELDLAVACGAAYYGWAKHHGGVRVRGGTARSYYVGIETAGLAVPGMKRPIQAVCVVPFGMEEGSEADVPGREVGLVVGKPARFRFFASSQRRDDRPGDCLRSWNDEELMETSPMELTLTAGDGLNDRFVSVRFHSKITELGSLELWCQSTRDARTWKLEFNVRS